MTAEDKPKFLEIMTAFCERDNKSLGKFALRMYFESLKDLSIEEFEQAAVVLFQTHKFFPKPADFREALGLSSENDAILAWSQVVRAAKHIGAYESVQFSDPVIHSVIEAMGGWIGFCDTPETELKWKAKEFQTLYKAMKAKTGHPVYLPGIVERDNAALGFLKNIPEPRAIEAHTMRKLSSETNKNNVKMLRGIQNNSGPETSYVTEG